MNFTLGIVIGAFMASGYSVIAVLIYLFSGPDAFAENGVSFASVIAAYWVGGLSSGALLGLFMPLTRSKRLSALVGPIIAAPAVAMIVITLEGWPWHWDDAAAFTFVIMAVIFGVYGGFVFGGRSDAARPEH